MQKKAKDTTACSMSFDNFVFFISFQVFFLSNYTYFISKGGLVLNAYRVVPCSPFFFFHLHCRRTPHDYYDDDDDDC